MEKELQAQLNLSDADLQEWKQLAGGDDLAVWAYKNNKIEVDKYAEWACEKHQIPFVQDSFFHDVNINYSFWNEVKDRAEWSEKYLPVYKWEKIIFAACLEFPKEKTSVNIVPILVSPEKLDMCWQKIQNFTKVQEAIYEKTSSTTENKNPKTTDINQQKTVRNTIVSKSLNLFNTIVNQTILTQIEPHSSQNVYEQLYQLSSTYFKGVIIFSFQNNVFKPIEWSPSMEGPATPIPIDKPSVFKMIVNSRVAYHGFIAENPVHKNFFEPWGYKTLPKHVTLVPLISPDKIIIGAYMGISDVAVHQKFLYKIKNWTKHITKHVKDSIEQLEDAA